MGRIRGIILFCVMVAAVVIVLRLLDWVPSSISSSGVNRYKTLEDVETSLKIEKIYQPVYFPQHLTWPPSEIFAQGKPYPLVVMHFTDRQGPDIVLAIRQSDLRDPSPLRTRLELASVGKQEDILLKGRRARVSLGTCRDGETCNSVSWREGDHVLTVTEKGPEEELLRIAESMLAK
jgi:hypothetical protein